MWRSRIACCKPSISQKKLNPTRIVTNAFLLDKIDYSGEDTIEIRDEVSEREIQFLNDYLRTRKPAEQLDALRLILDRLHEKLIANFEVKDVLLRVGERTTEVDPNAEGVTPVATENRIRAGAAAAMGYSHRRGDRPPDAARRIARRGVQIGCGSRSRDGISPPAACCAAAIRAGEAQAALCRSLDLRLALSAVPLLA